MQCSLQGFAVSKYPSAVLRMAHESIHMFRKINSKVSNGNRSVLVIQRKTIAQGSGVQTIRNMTDVFLFRKLVYRVLVLTFTIYENIFKNTPPILYDCALEAF